MYPILIKLGFITIYTAGVLHVLAFAVAIWCSYHQAKRFAVRPQQILDLAWVIVIWSLVGARLFSILFDGNLKWYFHNPAEVLMIWKGGFTFYGGFLFGSAAGGWYVHKNRLEGWRIADLISPGLALGMAIGRFGCFASGDSFGKPTGLPWAVTFSHPHSFAPTDIPLHPTQIYSVITNLVVFGILLGWQKRKRFQGELFLVFMLLYAITRSMVEIFRNDPRGVYLGGLVSTSQIISMVVAIAAVVFYIFRSRKYHSEHSKESIYLSK